MMKWLIPSVSASVFESNLLERLLKFRDRQPGLISSVCIQIGQVVELNIVPLMCLKSDEEGMLSTVGISAPMDSLVQFQFVDPTLEELSERQRAELFEFVTSIQDSTAQDVDTDEQSTGIQDVEIASSPVLEMLLANKPIELINDISSFPYTEYVLESVVFGVVSVSFSDMVRGYRVPHHLYISLSQAVIFDLAGVAGTTYSASLLGTLLNIDATAEEDVIEPLQDEAPPLAVSEV